MFVLVGPSVAALALGLLSGGSFRGLARTIAGWPVVVVGIAIEWLLAKNLYPDSAWLANWGHWAWALSLAAMLPVLLVNARRTDGLGRVPWLIASLGLTLNLTVIFTNGGYMPVELKAIEETHQTESLANPTRFRRDVLINADTLLPLLSDILPEPAFLPSPKVLSVGDVLVSTGLASWIFWAVRARRVRPSDDFAPQSGVLGRDSQPRLA